MSDPTLERIEQWLAGGDDRVVTLVGSRMASNRRWTASRIEAERVTQYVCDTPAEALTMLSGPL